jgi:hypothetical protein
MTWARMIPAPGEHQRNRRPVAVDQAQAAVHAQEDPALGLSRLERSRAAFDPRACAAQEPCGRIWRATGAAAWAPKPPWSTVTTITIGLLVA